MPRVIPLTDEGKIMYQKEKVSQECLRLMLDNNISRTKLAAALGITPQAVSRQLKSKSVRLETVLAVIYMSHTEGADIASMMTISN